MKDSKKQQEKIYIVTAISVRKRTEAELREMFARTKAKHSIWREKTFEQYVEFLKGWKEDKWAISTEDITYFLNKKDAEGFVQANCGDMNECGSYPYASITWVYPGEYLGRCSRTRQDVSIWEYVDPADRYTPAVLEDKELLGLLCDEVRQVISGGCNNEL